MGELMWLCHPVHRHSFYVKPSTQRATIRMKYQVSVCAACQKSINGLQGCSCLSCGVTIHRSCLSAVHAQNMSTTYQDQLLILPHCNEPVSIARRLSIADGEGHIRLLEDLSLDPTLPPSPMNSNHTPRIVSTNSLALVYIQRYAPYVAGGVLLGGAAIFGMPAVAITGIGVSLSGHTYEWSKTIRKAETQDTEWARRICWDLKQKCDVSDNSYKQDAALLRRYHNHSETPMTTDDIHNILFDVFASPDELVGQVNSALHDAYRARAKTSISLPGLVRDAQVYIGHILAVTLNTYPALSTSEVSLVHATEAVEKIVYSDIFPIIFKAFRREYARHDSILVSRVCEMQKNRKSASRGSMHSEAQSSTLKALEQFISIKYPIGKLQALADAFRYVCADAEARDASAPSADILLPMVVDLVIDTSSQLQFFVAHLALTSTLTKGGGQGMEGYALTTFHAALRALASIEMEEVQETDDDDVEDEFFDALDVTSTPR